MRFAVAALAALSAASAAVATTAMTGGDATFYAPGLGSCGHFNTETDFIVAVDIATIQSFPGATANPNANPMCGRQMKVTSADGKSVTVTVADTCPGCAPGSVDLTPTAFQQLAPLSVGRLHGVSWTLL
ncbi:hypothetical protein GSI_12115 [Ganoderma sinense ZZ0214-1]|uniref:RlpA-like protein double-psi beta-barrel domain-containing protein n=1 Tax=Ganoderma sinense ZZ0214-1 TaxID=1077348 RepID=A0A2G8RXW1_9APHY|nr:hypothetical protein GSI_12115 [Ganoderma sinense ZZ0214-1]